MPTPTYDLLDSVTLSSSASSVTFSSIDQSYRDLIIVASGTYASNGFLYLELNGSAANRSYVYAYGNGSTYASGTGTDDLVGDFGTSQSNVIVELMDYAQTDKHKSMLCRTTTSYVTVMTTSRWASTAAVNQVSLNGNTQSFQAGTTIHLYGVH